MKRTYLLVFAMVICCSSCTTKKKATYDFSETYMVKQENQFAYQPGYECSAFASAYVLRHYGEKADAMELYPNFPNKLANGEGVYPKGIVKFFQDRGYEAEYVEDATVEEIKYEISSKKAPVIAHIHVEEPVETIHATHYVPIVGYDEENFYFAESLAYYANYKEEENLAYNRKTSIAQFEKLWDNIDGAYDQPYFRITK